MRERTFSLSALCLSITCCFSVSAVELTLAKTQDMGVVNKERITYWLEKRGELAKNATDNEKLAAVNKYISSRQDKETPLPGKLGALVHKSHLDTLNKMNTTNNTSKKSSLSKVITLNKASEQTTTTVKVLAIMIDFQDLKFDNHQLTPFDTDMYYDQYPVSHFNDLLFSPTGYTGPSNQNIESAYQYYQHESGEGLIFSGNTFGWVTADNNASYYGANNNSGNDDNVGELVFEAVTKAIEEHNLNLDDYDKTDYFDIDEDGIINEPDGIVDHIMVFHSSIGEEAGGGVLGSDAIWSHRSFVFDNAGQALSVTGSTTKISGYTIAPIDSATGVVVHEFGHDLGVIDEYDLVNIDIGAPVSGWSVMSSGSWLGSPSGSRPNSFSPYAREYFQTRYGGNWLNQKTIELSNTLNETIEINSATNHDSGFNQIKINLPDTKENFGTPYSGEYQYYSGDEHDSTHSLSFTAALNNTDAILTMKARWDIEEDYDYMLLKINGNAISGNHTKALNPLQFGVTQYISGKSLNINGTSGLGWVDLEYDLSSYKNTTVTIEIEYTTDPSVGGYGFAADDISITAGSTNLFNNGAENTNSITLNGFSQITDEVNTSQYYYVQLRDHTSTDTALSELNYDPGVLLWYRNEGVENNNVSQHAGEVFLGVVDADQNVIKRNNNILDTEHQLRDAAFSLYDQTSAPNDTHRTNNAIFRDTVDYSASKQPESGLILPVLGLNLEVLTQASNSENATVLISRKEPNVIQTAQSTFTVNLEVVDNEITPSSTFNWDMGDGTQLTGMEIEHTYNTADAYDVSVNYSTSTGNKELIETITVGSAIEGSISLTTSSASVSYSANLSGGQGDYIYRWNFGDNNGSTAQQSGNYTYSDSGNYSVILTVTDDTGQSFSFSDNITVLNPLTASFTSSTNNLIGSFTSNPEGGSKPYSYLWNFGDNTTSTEANPSHTYSAAGSYSVLLTVTDSDDIQVTSTSSITITAPAIANNDNTSSGSSGGSITWLLLLALGVIRFRK